MRRIIKPLYLTPGILWVLLGGLVLGAISANPLLTCSAVFTMWLILGLVWRQGEPPILPFILIYQWVQAMVELFRANIAGLSLGSYAEVMTIPETSWLALGGLLMIAVGIRLSLRNFPLKSMFEIITEVNNLSVQRILVGYGMAAMLGIACAAVAWSAPQLRQVFLGLTNLKWVFFFLLAYVTLYSRKGRKYLLLVFFTELGVGMTSYFSEFKQPIFIMIIVYLSIGRQLTFPRAVRVLILALAALSLGVLWTCVKQDYRHYINEAGWNVSTSERIDKIAELYGDVEFESLPAGLDTLWDRISYIEFFARSVENVPLYIPHQQGALLSSAVMHVLVPRFLNPDKPAIDQTSLTERFTLLNFAEGTSVSLGYMAEFYIDFGWIGVLVGCLCLGFLLGSVYRYFMERSRAHLFGYMLASAVLMAANDFGLNLIILLGGTLSAFIMMAVLAKFFIPSIHNALLKREPVR